MPWLQLFILYAAQSRSFIPHVCLREQSVPAQEAAYLLERARPLTHVTIKSFLSGVEPRKRPQPSVSAHIQARPIVGPIRSLLWYFSFVGTS